MSEQELDSPVNSATGNTAERDISSEHLFHLPEEADKQRQREKEDGCP